jgi:hypothetical protein
LVDLIAAMVTTTAIDRYLLICFVVVNKEVTATDKGLPTPRTKLVAPETATADDLATRLIRLMAAVTATEMAARFVSAGRCEYVTSEKESPENITLPKP